MAGNVKEIIDITIPTSGAKNTASLGPILGQRGIKITEFKEELNKYLTNLKDNINISIRILIKGQRKFSIIIRGIPSQFYFKQLLNCTIAASRPKKQIIGVLDIRYLYEFANINSNKQSLISTIKTLMATAKSMGIRIE